MKVIFGVTDLIEGAIGDNYSRFIFGLCVCCLALLRMKAGTLFSFLLSLPTLLYYLYYRGSPISCTLFEKGIYFSLGRAAHEKSL